MSSYVVMVPRSSMSGGGWVGVLLAAMLVQGFYLFVLFPTLTLLAFI